MSGRQKMQHPLQHLLDTRDNLFQKVQNIVPTISNEEEVDDVKKETVPTGTLLGWTCPVCGRGNSPYNNTCPCKPLDVK